MTAQVEVSRDRYGYRIDGTFLRRVTTLCGGIPKDALPGWAAREVAMFAVEHRESWENLPKTDAVKLLKGVPWSKRDDAGDRGTAVHKTLEAIIRGEPVPDDLQTEDELACAIAAESFLEGWKPLGAEVTVFSRTHEYAGTFDLLAEDMAGRYSPAGTRWILDWKTSKGVYPSMAVQQAAYHHAEYAVIRKMVIGDPEDEHWRGQLVEWGPHRAGRLGIVHVQPDGATLHPIAADQVERLWRTFQAAREVKLFLLDSDPGYGRRPRAPIYDVPAVSVEV